MKEKYLKHFDRVFGTDTLKNIKFDNMKLLNVLFDYFEEELFKPSIEYDNLRNRQMRISDKLEENFSEEQQKLFEEYWEVSSKMEFELEKQLFMFGYIIAKKLDIETDIKE